MVDISIEDLDEIIFEKYEEVYDKKKSKEAKKFIDETQYGLNKFDVERLPDKNDPNFIYKLTKQLQEGKIWVDKTTEKIEVEKKLMM